MPANVLAALDAGLSKMFRFQKMFPTDRIIKGFRTWDEIEAAMDSNDETRLRVVFYGATSGFCIGRIQTFPNHEASRGQRDRGELFIDLLSLTSRDLSLVIRERFVSPLNPTASITLT